MSSIRLLALCLLCPLLTLGAPNGDEVASAPLRLELIPFTDPRATLIALDPDGRLRVVRFYPSRQVLANGAERMLSAVERKTIERALASPRLRQALRAPGLAGDGLTHGDLFRFDLLVGEPREIWGVVPAAPPVLRDLIDTLLRLAAAPPPLRALPLASPYVRARRVEPARAADLQASTPVRIVPLSACSPDLRWRLERAMCDPLTFHPLSAASHAELAAWRSLGDDVFVSTAGSDIWQLRLYSVE